MADHNVEETLRRFEDLEARRSNWDHHWQEVSEIVWPDAADFTVQRSPGEKRNQNLYDATAAMALEKFAAAMESMLTPRQQKWHTLKASDDDLNKDPEVKLWFEQANRTLFTARNSPRANYYSQKHEGYKSLGAFGNECLFIEENPNGGIRYRGCHIAQVFIETDPQGVVDTIYRRYPLSAKAAHQKWGERTPEKVRIALEKSPWQPFDFLHVVVPREQVDPEALDHEGMAWESLQIGIDDKVLIEESGYHELPYKYARYTVNATEMFGRGPAMLVLPSIKMTQEMQKTFIRAGHKAVDPPLLARDDGVIGMGSQGVELRSGYVTWGGLDEQGNPVIKPFISGAQLELTEGMLETERNVIKDAFLVTLFLTLLEHPEMTATEVLARLQEKGQLLAPTVGRQQSEMLGPQIERELAILTRQGFLTPLPPVLEEAEGEYEIVYESPAMRQQRIEEALGIQRTLEMAAPFIAADPTVLDVFKPVEIIRLSAEIYGAPSSILRTEEELEELTKRREEEAQAAQTAAALPELATAAKDLAQAGAVRAPNAQ